MKLINDDLIDIKINATNMYLLKKHTWTTKSIEDQVKLLSYSGEKKSKVSEVENAKLPPFNVTFYRYVFEYSKIPSEDDLFTFYLTQYYDEINNERIIVKEKYNSQYHATDLNRLGVRNRLLRSYPSFIRDFHFLVLCFESDEFDKSTFSLNIDYYEGYDVIVEFDKIKYGVSLYINSSRSKHYKDKKDERHDYGEIEEIRIPANFSECNEYGRISLFNQNHVKKVKNEILERQKKWQ